DRGHPLQLRHRTGERLRGIALRRPGRQPVHGVLLHAAAVRHRVRRPPEGDGDLHMIELFHEPNYNFIGRRKWAYIISLIITLIGLISLATKGLHYDIDFTGGTLVQVRFEKPPSVASIRAGLTR